MAPARSPEATSAAIDTSLRELIGICQQTIRAAEEALGIEPADVSAELREKVAAYENAINWGTSCLSCATVLDSSIRDHERAERATEAERERWLTVLADHYLMGVTCNEATGQDNPVCGCSRVYLGWHSSIGAARQAWLDHVESVVAGDHPEVPGGTAEDPAPVLPKREPLTGYLQCQSLPGQLRYLAERLTEGSGPHAVALALNVIADEQDGEQL